MKKLLVLLSSIACITCLFSQPGQVDLSFGTNGKVLINFTNQHPEYGRQIAVQDDGKIIILALINNQEAVVRLLPDGTVDNGFGTNGFNLEIPFPVSHMALQADGKILVAGSKHNGQNTDFAVIRLTAFGTIDHSFGNNGTAVVDFGAYDAVRAMTLTSEGKIVLAGQAERDFGLAILNTDGSLDKTFNTDGLVTINFGDFLYWVNAIAIQKDGKIVIAGITTVNAGNRDFAVVRLNPDGNLDRKFGREHSGGTTTDFGGFDDANAIALQEDGKIIVAGLAVGGNPDLHSAFALARYNNDGSLDETFGDEGKVTTDFGNRSDNATSLAVLSDGKIVAAGLATDITLGNGDFAIARYNRDGSLDHSFGTLGKQTTDFFSKDDQANSLAVLADGKILIAGYISNSNNIDIGIVRYSPDGSLDNSFNGSGKLAVFLPIDDTRFTTLAVQADKKILAGGGSVLVRYHPDGSIDHSFGQNGKVINDFGGSITEIKIQPDQKVLVMGRLGSSFFLARYNTDGTPDPEFGTNGKEIYNYDRFSRGSGLAIQNDGKIIVVGAISDDIQEYKLLLARYHNNGTPDNSFGTGGHVITDFNSDGGILRFRRTGASDVQIQDDGKIVVAGNIHSFFSVRSIDWALMRYNSDGSLDNSFGSDGKVITDLGFYDENASSLLIQPDGKIVVVGHGNFYSYAAVRYLSNGALDESFSDDGIQTISIANLDYATSAVLQNDGKIFLAGSTTTESSSGPDRSNIATLRLNTDGTLDLSYGNNGISQDIIGEPYAMVLDDKRIYLAGTTSINLPGGSGLAGFVGAYQLEATKPSVSISDATAYERDGWANLTITLSQAVSQDLMLHYQTIDGSASHITNDYRREVGAVFIPAGKTSTILRLKIHRDKLNEPTENFTVHLSLMFAPKGLVTLSDGTATVTILDGKNPDPKSAARMMSTSDEENTPLASVIAYPNPSSNYFNIVLQGSGEQAHIKVSDAQGRIVEAKNAVASKGIIQLGANYRPGVYYIEITQGAKKQTLKLLKQGR